MDCFKVATQKLGFENILEMYPIGVDGDPKSETFDEANNLWLVSVLKRDGKHDEQEEIKGPVRVFVKYILPVIKKTQQKIKDDQVILTNNIYRTILKRLWETMDMFSVVDRRTRSEQVI